MQLISAEFNIGMVVFPLLIATGVLCFPVVFIMYLLMPKAVLKKYFKPPYFSETEVVFFTGLPFFMMRTVMFMGIFAFPERGKVRGLTEAYLMVPLWYRHLSKFCIVATISAVTPLITISVAGYLYLAYTGQIEW